MCDKNKTLYVAKWILTLSHQWLQCHYFSCMYDQNDPAARLLHCH